MCPKQSPQPQPAAERGARRQASTQSTPRPDVAASAEKAKKPTKPTKPPKAAAEPVARENESLFPRYAVANASVGSGFAAPARGRPGAERDGTPAAATPGGPWQDGYGRGAQEVWFGNHRVTMEVPFEGAFQGAMGPIVLSPTVGPDGVTRWIASPMMPSVPFDAGPGHFVMTPTGDGGFAPRAFEGGYELRPTPYMTAAPMPASVQPAGSYMQAHSTVAHGSGAPRHGLPAPPAKRARADYQPPVIGFRGTAAGTPTGLGADGDEFNGR
jgi:hypothetical protein